MIRILIASLFIVPAASAQQDGVLKLTAQDFENGKSITIKEGKYDKVQVENRYAMEVRMYDNKLTAGGQLINTEHAWEQENSFMLDISKLKSGTYYLYTYVNYRTAELTLIVKDKTPPMMTKNTYTYTSKKKGKN